MITVLEFILDVLRDRKNWNVNTVLLCLCLGWVVWVKHDQWHYDGKITDINTHLMAIDTALENKFNIKIISPRARGWQSYDDPPAVKR